MATEIDPNEHKALWNDVLVFILIILFSGLSAEYLVLGYRIYRNSKKEKSLCYMWILFTSAVLLSFIRLLY